MVLPYTTCSALRGVPYSMWAGPEEQLDKYHISLFEGLGARHEVTSALSALEAYDPWEEFVVCHSEIMGDENLGSRVGR